MGVRYVVKHHSMRPTLLVLEVGFGVPLAFVGGGIWQQSRIEMTLGIILLFLVLSEMDDAWHWHTSVMRWVRRLYQMGLLRWQSARATILERWDKDGRGGL